MHADRNTTSPVGRHLLRSLIQDCWVRSGTTTACSSLLVLLVVTASEYLLQPLQLILQGLPILLDHGHECLVGREGALEELCQACVQLLDHIVQNVGVQLQAIFQGCDLVVNSTRDKWDARVSLFQDVHPKTSQTEGSDVIHSPPSVFPERLVYGTSVPGMRQGCIDSTHRSGCGSMLQCRLQD